MQRLKIQWWAGSDDMRKMLFISHFTTFLYFATCYMISAMTLMLLVHSAIWSYIKECIYDWEITNAKPLPTLQSSTIDDSSVLQP